VRQQPEAFDHQTPRWLARWLGETPGATIEQAAELVASLADLPAEPAPTYEAIKRFC
jgi:hypothetical protein